MLTAGERGGIKIESLIPEIHHLTIWEVSGKEIAISTTNGTIAVESQKVQSK